MNQLPPANRIPRDEWITRCDTFFVKYPHMFGAVPRSDINELFTLHNDKLTPRETGKYCSSCCGRVYERLKQQYKHTY